MEVQIQDLVSSIKKEGIDAAQREAEAILADARQKADTILADARVEAARTKDNAAREIELMKDGAAVSASHARRDALLSFKAEVQQEFEKLLSADVRKVMSGDSLARLITAALSGEDVSRYAVEVAEVSDALRGQLAEQIQNGLELRPSREVAAGFRIAAKDGSGYFDCTDDEIARMLMPFFNNLSL